MNSTAKTIVLIHGLWLTPRSWEYFKKHYESRGYRVLAPAWPRMKGEVEAIRRDPSSLAGLGAAEIVDHYAEIVRSLEEPPILVGHSFGGLIVQMLLDRGLCAAGVAIDSVAPRGVLALPFSAIKAASPVLSNPFNYRRTVPLTFEQFRYAFANVMTESDARAAYERYAIPGPGRPIFQAATANLNPRTAAKVNYRNGDRAPLLLIAGSEDHQIPPAVNRETSADTAARRRSRLLRNSRAARTSLRLNPVGGRSRTTPSTGLASTWLRRRPSPPAESPSRHLS